MEKICKDIRSLIYNKLHMIDKLSLGRVNKGFYEELYLSKSQNVKELWKIKYKNVIKVYRKNKDKYQKLLDWTFTQYCKGEAHQRPITYFIFISLPEHLEYINKIKMKKYSIDDVIRIRHKVATSDFEALCYEEYICLFLVYKVSPSLLLSHGLIRYIFLKLLLLP